MGEGFKTHSFLALKLPCATEFLLGLHFKFQIFRSLSFSWSLPPLPGVTWLCLHQEPQSRRSRLGYIRESPAKLQPPTAVPHPRPITSLGRDPAMGIAVRDFIPQPRWRTAHNHPFRDTHRCLQTLALHPPPHAFSIPSPIHLSSLQGFFWTKLVTVLICPL